MTVNTKKVQGRRTIRYDSFADMLADAEQMATSDIRLLGNWSLGQILKHNAMSLDTSIDGVDFSLPAPVRWIMTLLMKNKFVHKSLPAGFKGSDKFVPGEDVTIEEGLEALRKAVERQERVHERTSHPAFGTISNDEWTGFLLRHAEMHMSFVVPNN